MEVKQTLIVVCPEIHAAAIDVVGEVVNDFQAETERLAVNIGQKLKIDVVDGFAVFKTVNQIQRRTTDAFNRGQAQFHYRSGDFNRLRAQFQGAFVGLLSITYAETHAAGTRAVFGSKISGLATRLTVDDKVDVTLAVKQHIFRAVLCD